MMKNSMRMVNKNEQIIINNTITKLLLTGKRSLEFEEGIFGAGFSADCLIVPLNFHKLQ